MWRSRRFFLSLLLALFAAIDNVTTWIAVSHGAHEINPISSLFLFNIVTWTIYTIAKVLLTFIVAYRIYGATGWIYIYIAISAIFIQASITNIFNFYRLMD